MRFGLPYIITANCDFGPFEFINDIGQRNRFSISTILSEEVNK